MEENVFYNVNCHGMETPQKSCYVVQESDLKNLNFRHRALALFYKIFVNSTPGDLSDSNLKYKKILEYSKTIFVPNLIYNCSIFSRSDSTYWYYMCVWMYLQKWSPK